MINFAFGVEKISSISIHVIFVSSVSSALMNSFLNPLIYSVRLRQFRVAIIEIILKKNYTGAEDPGCQHQVQPKPRFYAGSGLWVSTTGCFIKCPSTARFGPSTSFTKVYVQIKDSAKFKIAQNAVLLTTGNNFLITGPKSFKREHSDWLALSESERWKVWPITFMHMNISLNVSPKEEKCFHSY